MKKTHSVPLQPDDFCSSKFHLDYANLAKSSYLTANVLISKQHDKELLISGIARIMTKWTIFQFVKYPK